MTRLRSCKARPGETGGRGCGFARWRGALPMSVLLMLAMPGGAQAMSDPWEAMNRRMHGFNALAQAHLLSPLAAMWREKVPEGWRQRIGRAVGNLGEPVTAASGLVAGEFGIAQRALTRFAINTTLGLGGVRDEAAGMGWPRRGFGPGDAACAWGVPSGPYLVLPLLGPSTLRDATAGVIANAALAQGVGMAPVAAWQGGESFLAYEGAESALRRVQEESLDPYAVMRSAWGQRRAARCAVDRAGLDAE